MTAQVLAFIPRRRSRADAQSVPAGIVAGMSQLALLDELEARGLKVNREGFHKVPRDSEWLPDGTIPQHFYDLVTRVRAVTEQSRNEQRRNEPNEK